MQHTFRVLLPLVVILAILAGGSPPIALGASPQLQVFFASDFNDSEYQKKAYSRVAGKWKMPEKTPAPGAKVVVQVVIFRDGRVPTPTVSYQSGSDAWDAAALDAVIFAKPFPPLPRDWKRDTVEVHFHFIYAE